MRRASSVTTSDISTLTASGTFALCVKSIDQDTRNIAAHLTIVPHDPPSCPPLHPHPVLALFPLLALEGWYRKTPGIPVVNPVPRPLLNPLLQGKILTTMT